jgi:hypothetical protein
MRFSLRNNKLKGSEHMKEVLINSAELRELLDMLSMALSDATKEDQKQRIRKWMTYFSRLAQAH